MPDKTSTSLSGPDYHRVLHHDNIGDCSNPSHTSTIFQDDDVMELSLRTYWYEVIIIAS